ncbi:MAG: hypothetical protein AB1696_16475 [Planctomycetota bacterium]
MTARRSWVLAMFLGFVVGSFCAQAQEGEDRINFDNAKVEVKNIDGNWKITAGDLWLLDFGKSEDEARLAFRIIKHYGLNAQCFIGRPKPTMEYYLVDGKSPVGPFAGEDAIAFRPERLEVKQIQGRWKIVDGETWLMDFGDRARDVNEAYKTIQSYGFDHICFVGRPDASWTYFRKDGEAPAPAPAPAPAAVEDATKGRLEVTVLEADRTVARQPRITVCRPDAPAFAPVTLMENPSCFTLEPGTYEVTASVGTGQQTIPRTAVLEAGKTVVMKIGTGTGTLELTLTAGGRPMSRVPVVELRAAGQPIAAASESPAKFQVQEGAYLVRVNLGSGQQTHEVPDVSVLAGETTQRTIDVPCALISIAVSGGAYGAGGKFPYVEIQQGGKMAAALMDNPARFLLLRGDYKIGVREGDQLIVARDITVQPGQDQTIELQVK